MKKNRATITRRNRPDLYKILKKSIVPGLEKILNCIFAKIWGRGSITLGKKAKIILKFKKIITVWFGSELPKWRGGKAVTCRAHSNFHLESIVKSRLVRGIIDKAWCN